MAGVGLALAAWAVSGQSFWMDEGYTLRLTWGHSFHQFLQDFRECNLADGAMPVYMVWIWLVTHLSGPSEFWIRFLGNTPWFVFSVAAGVWIARRLRVPALPLLLMVSPFTWFYLDELRPYVMQIMGGTMALAYAVTWAQTGHARPTAWQAAGIFIAAGSSLTEFVSLACWLAAMILIFPRWNRAGWSRRLRAGLLALGILGPWAIFYAWRSMQGQVHSPFWQLSPMHAVFSLYEFFGFSGMGPERGALRELAGTGWAGLRNSVSPQEFAMIGILGLVWVALIIFALRRPGPPADPHRPVPAVPQPPVAFRGRVAGVAAAAWMLNTLGLYGLAAVSDMPIYARHLAGIFVAVPLLAALAIARVPSVRWQKALLLALAGLWMLSALNLRHLPQHRKDDYRTAARMAAEDVASKKTVWWAASPHAARFYGLTLSEGAPAAAAAMLTVSPAADFLDKVPLPDKIYLSKTDLFDRKNEIQNRMKQSSYRLHMVLPGFKVYQKVAPAGTTP